MEWDAEASYRHLHQPTLKLNVCAADLFLGCPSLKIHITHTQNKNTIPMSVLPETPYSHFIFNGRNGLGVNASHQYWANNANDFLHHVFLF